MFAVPRLLVMTKYSLLQTKNCSNSTCDLGTSSATVDSVTLHKMQRYLGDFSELH